MKELTDKADCVIPVENQVCSNFKTHKLLTLNLKFCDIKLFFLMKALLDICDKASVVHTRPSSHIAGTSSAIKQDSEITSSKGGVSKSSKPFDDMNNIVAHLLLNLTRYINK